MFSWQAGALMVVGLLATRATLAPKLAQNLILFVARVAQQDSKQSPDLSWLRVVVMAMVSLVQVRYSLESFMSFLLVASSFPVKETCLYAIFGPYDKIARVNILPLYANAQ